MCAVVILLDVSLSRSASAGELEDHIGQRLRTAPLPPTDPPVADPRPAGAPIQYPLLVPAGQSFLLEAGASSLSGSRGGQSLAFTLGRRPGCGAAWETPRGVVLDARPQCAGQRLEFDYDVGAVGSHGDHGRQRVAVEALIQAGVTSCGIADAPYQFISIPGGSYSLRQAPVWLADLVSLLGTASVNVDPFCISEEAVPQSEMELFVAALPEERKQQSFPEALDAEIKPVASVETGRSIRAPALAVSYRMATGYAERESGRLDRPLHLPKLEHYVAAVAYLADQRREESSSQSFFISLRGGQMEWTGTQCGAGGDRIVVLGTSLRSRTIERYCYDVSRRVAAMAFRVVAETARGGADDRAPSRAQP